MLGASTTLYLLALLSSQPAFTAALVQIEPGLEPRLPKTFGAGKRSNDIPAVIRGVNEVPLDVSPRSIERAAVEARQDVEGRMTSGRQTLGTVAGCVVNHSKFTDFVEPTLSPSSSAPLPMRSLYNSTWPHQTSSLPLLSAQLILVQLVEGRMSTPTTASHLARR